MKKITLAIAALALCATMGMSSCSGNHNDKCIKEYKDLVEKAAKCDDPAQALEIAQEANQVLSDLDEETLTDSQKEEIVEIGMKAATQMMKNAM